MCLQYIEWFGVSVLSYLAATPLALLVELPAQRLHKEITFLLERRFARNKMKIEENNILSNKKCTDTN